MTIAFQATSSAYTTTATGVRGTTSINLAYSGVALGRMAIIVAEGKISTQAWGADPVGFTKLADITGGAAGTGVDIGPTRIGVWYRILDGSETGNATVTLTGGTQVTATMSVYSNTAGEWAPPIAVTGSDASANANVSFTGGAWASVLAANDMVVIGYASNTDNTAVHSALTLTQSGATFGTVNGRSRLGGSDGNDGAIFTWDASVITGSANAPTFATTWAASSSGAGVFVRLREQTLTARTPPTLIAFDQTATWQSSTTPRNFSGSLTWLTGDVLVVVGVTEDAGITLTAPTVTGLTFNPIGSANVVGNSTYMHRWVAIAASGGSGTISIARGASSGLFGAGVWQYRGSDGLGATPAISVAVNVKTATIIETQHESAIINVIGDWGAGAVSSPTWTPSGQTQRVASDGGGATYSALAADWADAGLATSTAYGVTAGLSASSNIAKAVIEVLGTAGSGAVEHFASATLTGESTLTAVASNATTASATLTGQSNLTSVASANKLAAAVLTGQSSLTAIATRIQLASAVLTGQSNLTANATNATTGATVLSGQSDLTATAIVGTVPPTANLSGQLTMTVTASVVSSGSAVLSGQSNLISTALKTAHASATLTGQSNLSIVVLKTSTGSTVLSGQSNMVVVANSSTTPPSSVLSGQSNLTVIGSVIARASAILSGQSALIATGINSTRGVVTLSAQSSIASIGTRVVYGASVLTGQSILAVEGRIAEIITGAVILSGQSDMVVEANTTPPWVFLLIELGNVTASSTEGDSDSPPGIESQQTVINAKEFKTQVTFWEGG